MGYLLKRSSLYKRVTMKYTISYKHRGIEESWHDKDYDFKSDKDAKAQIIFYRAKYPELLFCVTKESRWT